MPSFEWLSGQTSWKTILEDCCCKLFWSSCHLFSSFLSALPDNVRCWDVVVLKCKFNGQSFSIHSCPVIAVIIYGLGSLLLQLRLQYRISNFDFGFDSILNRARLRLQFQIKLGSKSSSDSTSIIKTFPALNSGLDSFSSPVNVLDLTLLEFLLQTVFFAYDVTKVTFVDFWRESCTNLKLI